MLKKLTKFLAAAALAVALMAQTAAPPQAGPRLDTSGLEAYFRHLLMWPPAVEVTMDNPTQAPIPGYYRLKVRGSLGGKTQEEAFIVSADSQIVVRGDVFDVKKSPFQVENSILKTDDLPFLGRPGAPVTVVEFSDFQCPFCRQAAATVRSKLTEAYPNDVQLVYMDYPITQIHPFARGASVLGRCIYTQDNASFWRYHDWIFEHQGEITPDNLRDKVLEYAGGDSKLDVTKLAACAVAPEPRAAVDRTVAMGDALRISATPTLFINGRRLVGVVSIEDLKLVVDHEIAWAKAQKKDTDCCSVQLSLPGSAPTAPAGKAAAK